VLRSKPEGAKQRGWKRSTPYSQSAITGQPKPRKPRAVLRQRKTKAAPSSYARLEMISASSVAEMVRAGGYATETPLVVGVSTSGEEVVVAQGAGLDGAAFGADSLAYAASVAKQITGACAALLERRGVLDPDAPIAEWMSELPLWRERVRVRHLIHHTAGLPDVRPQMQSGGESNWTSAGVVAALADIPQLDSEPGSAYAYTSVGYIVLAAIVERIAGSPFPEFARARIFEPLGMKSSVFWTGPSAAPPTAAITDLTSPAALSAGDGGLWTTVSDLLRWNAALLDDRLGITSRLHTTGSLDDGTPLDYAWGVRVFEASGQGVQSHGGNYANATAKLVRLPDSSAHFAVLAADSSVERLVALGDLLQAALIQQAVLDALKDE
jgi:CubicO group peptidase (beta-lactamase class C family)